MGLKGIGGKGFERLEEMEGVGVWGGLNKVTDCEVVVLKNGRW